MKSISLLLVAISWATFLNPSLAIGQVAKTDIIESKQLDSMVVTICELLESKYIDEDMGKELSNGIKTNHLKGDYGGMSFEELGKQLREDFLKISDDVHMNAFFKERVDEPEKDFLANKLDDWGAASNFGFVEFKISRNNIGYLKIGHFGKQQFFTQQKRTAANCIRMLENSNAIIIDVRGNPGGYEDIVAYFMSYFFDQPPFLLQEYYCRYEDRSRSVRTSDIPGKKLSEVPVYILVDKSTGSAAESLAYMMKHLKRATVIGEKTVGAGNGSTYFHVASGFNIQIATWETINAVTKTSWEKVGVLPDVETTSEAAFDKASELAREAGKRYRSSVNERYRAKINALDAAILNHADSESDDELINAIRRCHDAKLLQESDINQLGYSLLQDTRQPLTAEVVFKLNTDFFPDSANVYDSYAEALAKNGKLDEAIRMQKKAISNGTKSRDSSLELFKANLEKLLEESSKQSQSIEETFESDHLS